LGCGEAVVGQCRVGWAFGGPVGARVRAAVRVARARRVL
jgi:hypothetical protein